MNYDLLSINKVIHRLIKIKYFNRVQITFNFQVQVGGKIIKFIFAPFLVTLILFFLSTIFKRSLNFWNLFKEFVDFNLKLIQFFRITCYSFARVQVSLINFRLDALKPRSNGRISCILSDGTKNHVMIPTMKSIKNLYFCVVIGNSLFTYILNPNLCN